MIDKSYDMTGLAPSCPLLTAVMGHEDFLFSRHFLQLLSHTK